MPILIATMVIGLTGLFCGALLAVAARVFAVPTDPRIDALTALLPSYNCGGCSFGGCSEYATAIVREGAPLNLCKPGGPDTVHKLAALLGVEAAAAERQVAVVLCAGDSKAAARKYAYNGVADCASAALIADGVKACPYGCLGLGTCASVCPSGAIEIRDELATVHPELCIGCGKCVAACPRRIIKLVPESRFIHVLCSSKDRGPAVKKYCQVGCIGCTQCSKALEGKGIRMDGALAVVDYAVPVDNEAVIAKCPQKTIVKRSGRKEAPA